MAKRVLLVGHCGADSSYLRLAVQRADRTAEVFTVSDEAELQKYLPADAVLVLVNRLLDYGFEEAEGAALIARLAPAWPNVKFMMISNYPDAHAAAERAGGVPGFGKREIGSPRVTQLLAEALGVTAPASQP